MSADSPDLARAKDLLDHRPRRYRQGAVLPPVGAIEHDNDGAP